MNCTDVQSKADAVLNNTFLEWNADGKVGITVITAESRNR